MEIFFSVGEPSGDEHAAGLIRELKRQHPDCRCVGFGGEEMEQAGCEIHFPLTTMAVMGIMKVLPLLRKFWTVGQQAKRYFQEHKPDAVVLVDFPGFNWWMARYAHQAGIPVYYFLPPQLWAWGAWRVKRMHRYIDHVYSGLGFETDWYRSQGVAATFVGHPFFEEVATHPVNAQAVKDLRKTTTRVIGLLPGSRTMEVQSNWPTMLKVAERIHQRQPNVRFLVANYKENHLKQCREMMEQFNPDLPLEFMTGKTSEVIEAADCCLMVSGSVSLELLARSTPAVVLYRAGFVMGSLAKRLIRCRYMTLPNLMADREVMPEFPFIGDDKEVASKATAILDSWLGNPSELKAKRAELMELAQPYLSSSASEITASGILTRLGVAPRTSREAA